MIKPLPKLMTALNGAKRTKADHPNIPITIPEIVSCAIECEQAGADAIHAHVRDAEGVHVLDSGLYHELLKELNQAAPTLAVQITTEANGVFDAEQQRALVRNVLPRMVSVSLREQCLVDDDPAASEFYFWAAEAGVSVQHILYSPDELTRLLGLIASGKIPKRTPQVLFVLGHNAGQHASHPQDISAWCEQLPAHDKIDWALCAFGRAEAECLLEARRRGGNMRIGFENNILTSSGEVAQSNAAQVRDLTARLCRSSLT